MLKRRYDISPKKAKARSSLALAVQHNQPDEVVDGLRRDLKYVTAEEFILRIVAEAPQLSDAQREELAAHLRPFPSGAGAR